MNGSRLFCEVSLTAVKPSPVHDGRRSYHRAVALAMLLAGGALGSARADAPPYQYHATVLPSYNGRTQVVGNSGYWSVSPAGQALGQQVWVNSLSDNGGMAISINALGRYSGVATDGLLPVYTDSQSYNNLVWGINEAGHATGFTSSSYYGNRLAYYFNGSEALPIGALPGGLEAVAYSINDQNQIVGWAKDYSGYWRAYVYDAGAETPEMVSLHVNELSTFLVSTAFGINNNGLVVGVAQAGGGETAAFVFDLSTNQANSLNVGGMATSATAINDAGNAIGWYNLDGVDIRKRGAVLWQGANTESVTVVNLHELLMENEAFSEQYNSAASALNEQGWVVGNTWRSGGNSNNYTGLETQGNIGFLYDGEAVYSLNDLYRGDQNLQIEAATSINEHGQIGATAYIKNGSFAGRSGVVLSEIRAWDGTSGGDWDEAANWVGDAKPDAHTAAYVTLGDLQTLVGPADNTSIYALALGVENPGDSARLVLQEGAILNVIGDTRLTGATLDATAEGSLLQTGVLSGYGSLEGNVDAGWTWIDAGKTLSVSGTLNSAGGVLISGGSVLNAEGAIHGAISSLEGGQINATGNLVLGDAASNIGVTAYQLNAGEHQVTLESATHARVWDLSLEGGSVIAANGLETRYLSGHGMVDANVKLAGLVSATEGEALEITGNLTGAGLLFGEVNLGVEKAYIRSGGVTLRENVTYANGNARLLGSVTLYGDLSLEEVDLDSVGGVTTLAIQATPIYKNAYSSTIIGYTPHTVSGSGDWEVTNFILGSDTNLVSTGELAVGQEGAGRFEARVGSTVDIGAHGLTLRSGTISIYQLVSDGGSLHAAHGAGINHYSGHGELDGDIHFYNQMSGGSAVVLERSSVALTGNLVAGNAASENGFVSEGDLNIGAHLLTLLDSDAAHFTGLSETVISGGTLQAANGIVLAGSAQEENILNPLLIANGDQVASSLIGDVELRNAVLHATSGNSLSIDGVLSGYGVVVGDITWNQLNLEEDESVSVWLERSLGIEDGTARFFSGGESTVSGAVLSLAGGSIEAANGLALVHNAVVSGYGTLDPGAGNDLHVHNAILAAEEHETLLINGNVTGAGLVIGDVQTADGYTLFETPAGSVEISRSLEIGERTATFYSESAGRIVGSHQLEVDAFGKLVAYASTGELGVAGGSLVSPNGIVVENTRLFGYGSVEGDLAVQNSVVEVSAGESMVVNGNLTGYGVVIGDLGVQNTDTQSNDLVAAPSGTVDFVSTQQLLQVGNRVAKVYSEGEAAFGNVTSAGGTIESPQAGLTLQTYEGYGSIDGDLRLANSLIVVDKNKELNITGAFTGYGIVVGETNKEIANPTGTVNYNGGLNLDGRSLTIYSAEPAYVNYADFGSGGGSSVVLPTGAVFGQLRGSGSVHVSTGKTLLITGLLAPGSSPGVIEIVNGDMTLASTAITEIEFFGLTFGQYDFLDVEGTLTLGGQLKIIFDDGFEPAAGAILPNFFEAGAVEGFFSSVTWQGLDAGKGVYFDAITHQLSIINVEAVPEPGTWALALLGAGAFAWLRKRRAA